MRPNRSYVSAKLSPAEWLASPLAHIQMLLALAVALGGGGVAYGLQNFVIQACALLILWWHRDRVWDFARSGQTGLLVLVVLSVLLPFLQLVPLPPGLWQALPGREVVATSFDIAGFAKDSWFPASLDRGRTLVAFCGTFAPATLIILGSTMSPHEKARLAWTALGAAFVALLLGVVQLTSANTAGLLFPIDPKPNVLYASFANRNSTALMFVMAVILLACVPLYRGRSGLVLASGGIALFSLGAVLTQSRSGMALLGVALAFVVLRIGFGFWRARRGNQGINRVAVAGAAVLGVLVAGALAFSVLSGGRAADSLNRLSDGQTDRPQIWEDAVYGAGQYWPVGSGMGTFDEVFQLHESLEFLAPRKAGRAHNDYIELGIEAGVFGYLIALGWIAWIALASLRGGPSLRWTRLGAALALACIAAQSTLDYPLRNQTLLCFAALCIVLLARTRKEAV